MADMKSTHLSRLDLNLLKVFAAVHRERHITRAGRALFISQSAVSHSIAKLRVLFGDPLFVRTPDGMQPTALADRLADPIRRALQAVGEALQTDERFDPAAAELEFTVGTTLLQPFHFLPAFYRRIEQEAPRCNLLIRTLPSVWPDVLNALDDGSVDLLLTIGTDATARALATSRFNREDLFEDPLVCVVSKHNDLVGDAMDAATYARLPHLIMAGDRVTRTWIDDALEKRGLRRRIAVTAPHPFAIPLLTGGTRLVSTVARSLVAPFVDHGELRLLEPPIAGSPHRFQMIWSARSDRDPAQHWLRTIVRESCRAAESRFGAAERPARRSRSRAAATQAARRPSASRRAPRAVP
jgi:DNA-binding transcriptional LysR family regulator